MNYVGIILAKKHSERLPNKNFLKIGNQSVYKYAEKAIFDINHIPVYVFSDDELINNRPPGACLPDEPIFSALKWAYKSLPKRYDAIINIMANCPMISSNDVKRAVKRFERLGCEELRSFNSDGSESGLMILKESYLLNKHEVSTYQGAITIESKEIHTKKDFELCQRTLLQK